MADDSPLLKRDPISPTFERSKTATEPVERRPVAPETRTAQVISYNHASGHTPKLPPANINKPQIVQTRPAQHSPIAGLQHGPKPPAGAHAVQRATFQAKQRAVDGPAAGQRQATKEAKTAALVQAYKKASGQPQKATDLSHTFGIRANDDRSK